MKKKSVIRYSEAEQAILDLLPRNGRTTTDQLVTRRYSSSPPFNARGIINATLNNLIRKVDFNRETFKIVKGARKGPKSMEVWLENR